MKFIQILVRLATLIICRKNHNLLLSHKSDLIWIGKNFQTLTPFPWDEKHATLALAARATTPSFTSCTWIQWISSCLIVQTCCNSKIWNNNLGKCSIITKQLHKALLWWFCPMIRCITCHTKEERKGTSQPWCAHAPPELAAELSFQCPIPEENYECGDCTNYQQC